MQSLYLNIVHKLEYWLMFDFKVGPGVSPRPPLNPLHTKTYLYFEEDLVTLKTFS